MQNNNRTPIFFFSSKPILIDDKKSKWQKVWQVVPLEKKDDNVQIIKRTEKRKWSGDITVVLHSEQTAPELTPSQ